MENEQILDFDQSSKKLLMAGFWFRLAAFLLDVFLFFIIFSFLSYIIIALSTSIKISEVSFDTFINGMLFIYFLTPLISILIVAAFESSKYQGTPGKILLNLKITDYQGRRISFLRALGRSLGKVVSYFTIYIGYLMAIWTKKQQCLHDFLAKTYVINDHPLLREVIQQPSIQQATQASPGETPVEKIEEDRSFTPSKKDYTKNTTSASVSPPSTTTPFPLPVEENKEKENLKAFEPSDLSKYMPKQKEEDN